MIESRSAGLDSNDGFGLCELDLLLLWILRTPRLQISKSEPQISP